MSLFTLTFQHRKCPNTPLVLENSNQPLSQLPSPSNIIIQQYDQVYQQSIKAVQDATEKVMNKEAEVLELKKQIKLLLLESPTK